MASPDKPLKRAPVFAPTTIEAVSGALPFAGPAKTIVEMDAAVAAAAKRLRGNKDTA